MLILKFALFFFLAYMLLLINLESRALIRCGGPYVYADVSPRTNPVQPRFRLSPRQAVRAHRVWVVAFRRDGMVYSISRRTDGVETRRTVFLYGIRGRLRYERDTVGGFTTTVEVTPPETSGSARDPHRGETHAGYF